MYKRQEYMFDNVKKEMAEELLKNFVHEMRDLGFQKDVYKRQGI